MDYCNNNNSQLTPSPRSKIVNNAMPTDTILVDPLKIKSERLTPPPVMVPRSTPSPHHPLHHLHPMHHHHVMHQQHHHRTTTPSPSSSSSTSSSPSSASAALRIAAAANAAAAAAAAAGAATAGGPTGAATEQQHSPVLKQMEQMVTRNYSDIMRSLAAKYNNSNPPDRFNGAFERKFDGRFPTPPLLGVGAGGGSGKDSLTPDVTRKSDNHSAPPVLGEHGSPLLRPNSALGAMNATLGNTIGATAGLIPMMDMSSTQALLNMVRSANAQNASQLETYLRGAIKRPVDTSDPLDLSQKRSRLSHGAAESLLVNPYDAITMRLPGGATVSKQGGAIRDFRELLGSLKRDSDLEASSPHPLLGVLTPPTPTTPAHSPNKTPKLELNRSKSTGSTTASSPSSSQSSVDNRMHQTSSCVSLCSDNRACSNAESLERVTQWTVDDVCRFVASIDTCAEYVQRFREQAIDGTALPMLTEEHMINTMNMKLGPVLKLRATLAKKIGHCSVCMHCIHCHGQQQRPESS